jgi:anti-sigma factor RsiW
MKCDEAKTAIPLFLYNELSFDEEDRLEAHLDECDSCRAELAREKRFHNAFDHSELSLTSDLLTASRAQLRAGVAAVHESGPAPWRGFFERLNFRWHVPSMMQPVGAVALVALGFFGAHLVPQDWAGRFSTAGVAAAPVAMRVRNVEPESAGKVQITVEETQQRILLGDISDTQIQQLLLTASQDPNDPGLRSESVAALTRYPESLQIRDTLLSSLQHDSNAGVRLAALEGLKGYVQDAAVRNALSHVVLTDKNPGVRTQVIDLLIQRNEDKMTGVFQELMRNEPNDYVRLRCAKALRDMRASPGTF